ncbi:MAG: hypothetical protein WB626_04050 [Bacteroidota bacterium]
MRKLSLLLPFLLAWAGCREPADVVLPKGDADLALEALAMPDADYAAVSLDSAGVLPGDQFRFPGSLTIVRVTHDDGQTVRMGAFSRVLFENRSREIRYLGKRYGFHGIDLGELRLNGTPMARLPHRIRIRRSPAPDSLLVGGVEYLADLRNVYRPRALYTWAADSPDSLSPFEVSIGSPDELAVLSPAGGSIVERNRPLPLRWTGSGPMLLVVSGFDPATREVRPLFRAFSAQGGGSALLASRFLRLLPLERFRYYVFTFLLLNRDESFSVGGFEGRILVQAASVYNSYVELR